MVAAGDFLKSASSPWKTVESLVYNSASCQVRGHHGFIMPKQKTHKGTKKRFKITASGKAKHRKAFRGHKLGGKSGQRRRRLRMDGVVEGTRAKLIAEAIAPGI